MNTSFRHAIVAAVSVAAAVALAGCGSSDSSGDTSHDHAQATSSATSSSATSTGPGTAAHNPADITFATNMIPHHQQAVEMADLALNQASSAQVKTLAQGIKSAQDPEIRTMSGWLTAWGQPVPTPMVGHDMSSMSGMDGMMSQAEMQQLQSASGAAFDRMWVQMMIKHHEGAVAMATTEIQDGQDTAAKALAQQIITAQNTEIATMTQLLPTITG